MLLTFQNCTYTMSTGKKIYHRIWKSNIIRNIIVKIYCQNKQQIKTQYIVNYLGYPTDYQVAAGVTQTEQCLININKVKSGKLS